MHNAAVPKVANRILISVTIDADEEEGWVVTELQSYEIFLAFFVRRRVFNIE
jgi:hypothetical protein